MRVYFFGGNCELLDGEGAVGIVPEDGEDDVEGDSFVAVEKVCDCHLANP